MPDDQGLRDGLRPDAGDANPTLVGELEHLLEAARSGELVALAGACLHRDRLISYCYVGPSPGYAAIGGLDGMAERVLRIVVSHG